MLTHSHITPELHKDFSGPMQQIENQFHSRCDEIADWFAAQWQLTLPPVYGSIDLRNAGFKISPVDMNLFPAGFNNLNPAFLSTSIAASQKIIHALVPHAKKILLIAESHTRNVLYWENIHVLQQTLTKAGFDVHISILDESLTDTRNMTVASGETMRLQPMQRVNGKINIDGVFPDLILLNNDLSEGIPDILQHLVQPILPPAELGWSQRLKSGHFHYYEEVANEFAAFMQIDPWLIAPFFKHCGEVDFMQQDGMECVIRNATELFEKIQKKYDEYRILQQPFLVIKADAGTYGMGVMTVRHIDELRNLNRKQRTRMSATKGGQPVKRVIIQEGVYTFETVGPESAVAEPVVYLWGEKVVGGFYRIHKERGIDENLNAPGMQFEPLSFKQSCDEVNAETIDSQQKRYYLYGVIAKLSMLAAAREIERS